MRYLISGGGTGGHIYPALAIVRELKNRDKDAEILYVGTEKGLENQIVTKEGLDFKTIRIVGMPRKIGLSLLKAFKELALGLIDSNRIIKEFNPDIAIGTGGYVSGPILYMASRKKIKTIIHEQNVFPGITNKILANHVDKVLVTFEESIKYFKHHQKISITGNPIRENIINIDKEQAFKDLNIHPNIPLLLSFGGSGGQKKLNEAMEYVIRMNSSKEAFQIIHVTGTRFYAEFIDNLKLADVGIRDNIRVLPYFDDMPKALNIADLVVTSAGAITLSEISAIGIPSILIPKSYTAGNHQEYNAKAFSKKGAAHLILEEDLTGEGLYAIINDIICNEGKASDMKKKSRSLGRTDATEQIVDLITQLIR